MKKNYHIHLAIFLGLFMIFVGCRKDEGKLEQAAKKTLTVSDFAQIGEIHNAFLTNVKENFEAINGISDIDKKVEVITDFNKRFAENLDLPEQDKKLLIQGLEDHKELVVTKRLTTKCFGAGNHRTIGEGGNIFELIESLKATNQINIHTYSILSRLVEDLKSNYEHSLSDVQLKANIQDLVSEFNELGYSLESGEGGMTGTILAISIASIEWWEENPDAFADEHARALAVPVWAAADVVGAAWGAGTGAIGSYVASGEVNWKAVGVGTVSGAVSGSTGIVGKAGKWIASLF